MAAVCEQLDLPCKIARGLHDGQPHFWNVVTTENGWRHIDLSQLGNLRNYGTDDQWRGNSYRWIESTLPVCG